MSKQSIKIERLEIRLQGVSAQAARAAVSDLGHELLGRLATSANLAGDKRAGKIDRVDAGNVQLAAGSAPADVRDAIAGRVAVSIKSKLGNGAD